MLSNATVKMRFWRVPQRMAALARNADGDELLFVHEGAGDLYLRLRPSALSAPATTSMLPRGTMWRIESAAPMTASC